MDEPVRQAIANLPNDWWRQKQVCEKFCRNGLSTICWFFLFQAIFME